METSRESPASFSLRNVLIAAVPLALLTFGVIWFAFLRHANDAPEPPDIWPFLRMELKAPTKLDPSLGEATEDLVAAVPKDAKDLIDPDTLVFAVLEVGRLRDDKEAKEVDDDDDKLAKKVYADLAKHLEEKTGKKVLIKVWDEDLESESQMKALRTGKLHLAALSTGSVSVGVNEGGLIPFCVMADEKGQSGYHAEIIVPAGSPIKTPADLKGKKIGIVSSYSFSGFKAPIVVLWNEYKMVPGVDYGFLHGGGQREVADRIAKNELVAGAVASDLLNRRIAANEIDQKAIRSIYTSKATYPPACYGYAHQLKPELAEKIKAAFLDFSVKGSSFEKSSSFTGQAKFVPITYKIDWASVREAEQEALKLIEAHPAPSKK